MRHATHAMYTCNATRPKAVVNFIKNGSDDGMEFVEPETRMSSAVVRRRCLGCTCTRWRAMPVILILSSAAMQIQYCSVASS